MDDLPQAPNTFLHGRRQGWASAPDPVAAWVSAQLGEPIVGWDDQVGGMSTGIAAVVRGERHRLFVKGVDGASNPAGAGMYVCEAEAAARLPSRPEIPLLLASGEIETDTGTWVINVFPALAGRAAQHPWRPADLTRVLDAWHRLTPTLHDAAWDTTASLSMFFTGWTEIAADHDDPWHPLAEAWVQREAWMVVQTEGSTDHPPALSHIDLRADNILLADAPETADAAGTDVWFVDWAHPGLAAPWVDVALLLADVVGSGADRSTGGPINVVEVWRDHPACAAHDRELMITLAASLAAMLHLRSRSEGHPALAHRTVWAGAMADQLFPFVRRQS